MNIPPPPPPPHPTPGNVYDYGADPHILGFMDDDQYWHGQNVRAPTPPQVVDILDEMAFGDDSKQKKKKSKEKVSEKAKSETVFEPVATSYHGYMLERADPLPGQRLSWARIGKRPLPFDNLKLVSLVKQHRKQSQTTPAKDFAALTSNQQGVINRLLAEKIAAEDHPNAIWSLVDVQQHVTWHWKTKDVRKIRVILKRHHEDSIPIAKAGTSGVRSYQTEEIIDLSSPLPTKKKDDKIDQDQDQDQDKIAGKKSKKDKSDEQNGNDKDHDLMYDAFYRRMPQEAWHMPEMRHWDEPAIQHDAGWNSNPQPPYPFDDPHQHPPMNPNPQPPLAPYDHYHQIPPPAPAQQIPPQNDPNHYQPHPSMYNPRQPPANPVDHQLPSARLPLETNPFAPGYNPYASDYNLLKSDPARHLTPIDEPVTSLWQERPPSRNRSRTPEQINRQRKNAERNKRIGKLEDEVMALRSKIEDFDVKGEPSRALIGEREYYTSSPLSQSFSPPPTPPLSAAAPAGSLHTHQVGCRGSPCSCLAENERRNHRRSYHEKDLAVARSGQAHRRTSPRKIAPSYRDEEAMRYIESRRRMRDQPRVYTETVTHMPRRLRKRASTHSIDLFRFDPEDADIADGPPDDWEDKGYHRAPEYGRHDRPQRISRRWTDRYEY